MNQRTKELYNKVVGDDKLNFDSYLAEKFTELIVRECLDIAKNWEDQLENANSLRESNAVGVVAYRIARQFGVK